MENNKKYNFGVVIDLLHDKTAKAIRNRVDSMRQQARVAKYAQLDRTAQNFLDARQAQEAMYGVRAGSKPATLAGQRYHLLSSVIGLLVLTYRYANVKWEVEVALKANTLVMVFSPYKEEDLVSVKTLAQWEAMLDEEANPAQAKWAKELDANIKAVLNTPTPWLDCQSLQEVQGQFKLFSHFMEYVEAQISIIEELGEWDIETTTSLVYNEKASTWRNQTTREFGSRYKYANKEYWENYELLPVDVLTKYLHLSYLMSIDYKPLVKMHTVDDVDYNGKEIWLGSCIEDMVRATPIYLDVNDPEAMELYNQYVNETNN